MLARLSKVSDLAAPMSSPKHDIAIIGAGPGGSSAAYFLAKQGFNVLLLDKAEFPRHKTCGDGLTPRALDILSEMGLLEDVHREGFRIDGIHLFAPRQQHLHMSIPQKENLPNYLLTIPRFKLDQIIFERAIQAGAAFQGKTNIHNIEKTTQGIFISGKHNQQNIEFEARMGIIATGANLKLLKNTKILTKQPPMIMAARQYLDGVSGLSRNVAAYFDGIPLPGYGWVFPISDTIANIGVGYWPHGIARHWKPKNAHQVFNHFVAQETVREMLKNAVALEPVKGFPIRMDFPTAPTFGQGCLLVGEAAGLVNPLTGEGIDFALESGRLAAEHIQGMFERGGFLSEDFVSYNAFLRRHFQRLFVMLARIRKLYINPLLISRFIESAQNIPDLQLMLANIILGHEDAAAGVSPKTIRQVLLGK